MNQSSTFDSGCQVPLVDARFPWRPRKMRSFRLARLYEVSGDKQLALRAAGCSSALQFQVDQDTGDKWLFFANFCKLRLCPICSACRSRKISYRLSRVMDYFQDKNPDYQYIFLTLTQRNVSGSDLNAELDRLQEGWHRFVKNFKRDTMVDGWFKSLEITYHSKSGYHPHYHVVFSVPSDYFHTDAYMDHAEWRSRWAQAMRLDYLSHVNVKAAYVLRDGKRVRYDPHRLDLSPEDKLQVRRQVVKEVGKYPVKDTDYLRSSLPEAEAAEVVRTLTDALRRRRLMSFGGVLRQAAKELDISPDMSDLDDDLVHIDDEEELRSDLALMIEEYGWNFGSSEYLLTDRFVLD